MLLINRFRQKSTVFIKGVIVSFSFVKSGEGIAIIANKGYNLCVGNVIFDFKYIDFSGMRAKILFHRLQTMNHL